MSLSKNIPGYLGKFEIVAEDQTCRRITELKHYLLEIKDTHLIYQFAWNCELRTDPDDKLWTDAYQSVRQVLRRDRVSNLSIYYINAEEQWRIQIEIIGGAGDIYIHYLRHKEAKEMFEKLEAWYLEDKSY